MRPRVIIVSTATSLRGGEFQAQLLANGLSKRGYPVTIACGSRSSVKNLRFVAVKWVTFQHANGIDFRGCIAILREIRREPRSVLICNDSKALTLGVVVSLFTHVPLVAVRRVYFPFARNILSRWKYRRCSRIVAISSAIARRCVDTLQGIRVDTIPSSTMGFSRVIDRTGVRSRLGLCNKDLVCLSVADFNNHGKRLGLLLETTSRLKERYPPLHLLLVGPLPEETMGHLPEWCSSVGKSDDPQEYYAAADLYICTSIHEGLGTAILDAVVRDIPAVAPSQGGAGDLFPDSAWLADTIGTNTFFTRSCEILDNIENARSRSRFYGQWARDHFDTDSIIDKYACLLDELCLDIAPITKQKCCMPWKRRMSSECQNRY